MRALEHELASLATGTTFTAISKRDLAPFKVPIPPLAEQRRIVAKVDELMALCDELEEKQQRKSTVATRLRGSAFNALRQAETPDDLAAAWERISTNWSHLTHHSDSIPELRQTILELATRQLLVDSETTNGQRWPMASLEEIADVRLGRQRSPKVATGPRMRPYLRAANVGWGGLKLDDVKERAFTEKESATYELMNGDLLLGEASGSPTEVGKPAHLEVKLTSAVSRTRLSGFALRVDYPRISLRSTFANRREVATSLVAHEEWGSIT